MEEGEAVFPKKMQLSKLLHSLGGNVDINTVKKQYVKKQVWKQTMLVFV